ncbi:MAG: hypothetical protein Q8L62_05910 [Candidatus Nitrotoga sp.]|nr:hypothetical protein [Candidatus Nitrotoga sp.]
MHEFEPVNTNMMVLCELEVLRDIVMCQLQPASESKMAHYREHMTEFSSTADKFGVTCFSKHSRVALVRLMGGQDAARLIEAVVRCGNYSDVEHYSSMRKWVYRQLTANGVKLRRGKRPKPNVTELVSDLLPVLLYYGLPYASSEKSRVVRVLQIIYDELNFESDPRDELRRLNRLKRIQKQRAEIIVIKAMKNLLPPSTDNIEGFQLSPSCLLPCVSLMPNPEDFLNLKLVKAAWDKFMSIISEALLQIPSHVAPLIAADGDPSRVQILLRAEIETALHQSYEETKRVFNPECSPTLISPSQGKP